MATIATLAVSITAETTKFAKGIVESSSILNSFNMDIKKVIGKLFDLSAAGIAAAATGLGVLTKQGFDAVDTLGDVSNKLGIASDDLSGLQYAAKLSGVDTETFNSALLKMNATLGKAQTGSKSAQAAFTQLGLSTDEIMNESTGDQFRLVAESIAGIENPAERTSAAMAIFGKSGAELLPLLTEGGEGIQKMQDDANNLGAVINDIDVAIVQDCGDKFDTLGTTLLSIGEHIAVELAPYVGQLIDLFIEWTKEAGGTGTVVTDAMEWIGEAIATIAEYADLAYGGFQLLKAAIAGVFAVVGQLITVHLEMFSSLFNQIDKLVNYFADALPDSVVEGSAAIKKGLQEATEFSAKLSDELGKSAEEYWDKGLEAGDRFNNGVTAGKVKEYFNNIKASALETASAIALANERKRELAKSAHLSSDIEELQKFANDLFKDTRLPLEKFQEQIKLLTEAFQNGLIDDDLFNRATEKFKKDFEKDTDKKSKSNKGAFKEIDLTRIAITGFEKKQEQNVHDPQLKEVVKAIREVRDKLNIPSKVKAVVS